MTVNALFSVRDSLVTITLRLQHVIQLLDKVPLTRVTTLTNSLFACCYFVLIIQCRTQITVVATKLTVAYWCYAILNVYCKELGSILAAFSDRVF